MRRLIKGLYCDNSIFLTIFLCTRNIDVLVMIQKGSVSVKRSNQRFDEIFKRNLIENLKEILNSKKGIKLAYLYGSFLKENWTLKSDIDIGLVVDDQIEEDPWYNIILAEELNEIFNDEYQFDIRIINRRSAKFRYQVIWKTTKLVIRDENFRIDFETRTLLVWYDIRGTWIRFYEEQRKALR